jgi:hypothetical protein
VEVPYYDNLEATPIDGFSCLIEVERIYGLDRDRLDEDFWRGLARIYEGLPGAGRCRGVPWWLGEEEDFPPFLREAMGPPSLQVYGILAEVGW